MLYRFTDRGGLPSPASALEASQEALEQVLLHLKESSLDCSNPIAGWLGGSTDGMDGR